jgi:DNA-binding CsgD family transcriptional regulator/tetratricopeptide (TPR) repeat protein
VLARAAEGHGSTVLVSGEAGIGKSSLLEAFLAAPPRRFRSLVGRCEDLLTPRTLGPLRDAVRSSSGPLARALEEADVSLLLGAAADELAVAPVPTMLVVEDAHWADDATVDVLRYLGRRMPTLPAVLVISFRDSPLARDHPLRPLLGALVGADTVRLPLGPLSAEAVGRLAASTTMDPAELHRLTSGNPFFVSEVLAAPDLEVPSTVVDAVLGRVAELSPEAQQILDQVAVVPSGVDIRLLRAMVDDLAPLAEAERAGIVEVHGSVIAFRHELARRAVAQSLPESQRMALHARVLDALVAAHGDPFRILHHAVEAADDDAVLEHGPVAARTAHELGAHRQAASCYAHVLAHAQRLAPAERAVLYEAYAWALSNSNQLRAAAGAAAQAVACWQQAGDDRELVHSLVTLSRQQWLTEQTDDARRSAERALLITSADPTSGEHALTTLNVGALLVLADRELEGLPYLDDAFGLAAESGADYVTTLVHDYRGSAHLQLGDESGEVELLASIESSHQIGNAEFVLRGYYNLVEGLWRLGHYDRALRYLERGEEYAGERDFPAHSYMFRARRLRLLAGSGHWAEAVAGLQEMLDGAGDPGMIGRETIPSYARLLVRLGDPKAADVLALAREHAERADVLEWLAPTGAAVLEHAWLTGTDPGSYPERLMQRLSRPGAAVWRAEAARYLRRLGRPVVPFDDCPPAYAAGLRGDWRQAAQLWQSLGDPYEQALELAESGEVAPTLEALRLLDALAAEPAAALVRRRLVTLGVRPPRGVTASTRSNPQGLTDRQLEILRLVGTGLSNAEIAARLVVSTRTVDHHVSAILQKLGARTRRDAVAQLRTFEPIA